MTAIPVITIISTTTVIPAKAGIQKSLPKDTANYNRKVLDSRFRGNDEGGSDNDLLTISNQHNCH